MIKPSNGEVDWEMAIKETEYALISPDGDIKGNIVYDITEMVTRVDKFKSRYAKYQNIRSVLQMFVLQHYLHGCPVILLTILRSFLQDPMLCLFSILKIMAFVPCSSS